MELPRREKNDRFTPAGRYRELEREVRERACREDIPTLFIYAFDKRTSLGPFVIIEKLLIPGAPRAVASALYAAGFTKLRVVMQQWNPNIRPSRAKIEGRTPELLLVSSMQIHSAPAYDLIRDAWRLGEDRPLIIAGGAKAIYEPWDFFGLSEDGSVGADVVCTGEEYVLLELLDRVLEYKMPGEHLRQAFERARSEGALNGIPGLVFRPDPPVGRPEYLIDTGIQRLVQDLDELPLPFDAFALFEPPHRRETLSADAIPAEKMGEYARVVSVITTHGCKFHCPYCPIPGYNQFTFRRRSPERLVEEFRGVKERTGITNFFGTDDNFFNNRETVEEIFTAMARATFRNRPFRDEIHFATEATEFDVHKNLDLVPLAREGGLRSIWFGIEDLTADLIKKGQSPEKTKVVFSHLIRNGIAPMPMMMHHDKQPLWSWRGLHGLLNQVNFLFKTGAVTCQVTMLTPSVGSKGYEQPYQDGIVLKNAAGIPVEDFHYDGNHAIATGHPSPLRRQLNLIAAYLAFYNPINLLRSLPKLDPLWKERIVTQVWGMYGVAKSLWNTGTWLRQLASGPIEYHTAPLQPKFRLVPVEPALAKPLLNVLG
ncbi:MAG: radical SAM protein [Thermogutta sp.]|nr:radical SAM protein [Thermogutta sp.]